MFPVLNFHFQQCPFVTSEDDNRETKENNCLDNVEKEEFFTAFEDIYETHGVGETNRGDYVDFGVDSWVCECDVCLK